MKHSNSQCNRNYNRQNKSSDSCLILYLKSKKPINDKPRSSNLKREIKRKLKCGRHCNELSVIWSQRYLCNIIRDGSLKSVPMRENTDQKNIEYGHFTQCKIAPVLRLSVNDIYEFRYNLPKYLQRLRKSLLTCLIVSLLVIAYRTRCRSLVDG